MYSKPRINFLLLLLDGDPTASSISRGSNSNTSSQEVELLVNDWEWQIYSVWLRCLWNLLPGFGLLVDQLHKSLHLHETSAPHTVKNGEKSTMGTFYCPIQEIYPPTKDMGKQARTCDTVLVWGRRWQVEAKHCRGGWGRRGKDDRKKYTSPVVLSLRVTMRSEKWLRLASVSWWLPESPISSRDSILEHEYPKTFQNFCKRPVSNRFK